MMVVDTNILVRYAVKDDPVQTRVATEFLTRHECLVLRTVLLELVWVLTGAYKLPRETVLERIQHIVRLPTVSLEEMDSVLQALEWYEAGMDFADALHLASSLETSGFSTFDKALVNTAKRINVSQMLILLHRDGT